MPSSDVAGGYSSSFQFSEEPPYCSPPWLHQRTVPSAVHKVCLFSASSPVLVISCPFGDGHSDQCDCGFGFYFPDDE